MIEIVENGGEFVFQNDRLEIVEKEPLCGVNDNLDGLKIADIATGVLQDLGLVQDFFDQ